MPEESHDLTCLTRDELYGRVWATPMRRLAQEWGISDVGLAKVCRKHDIPCPPVGYWAKKEVGKAPAPTPLPPRNGAAVETIRIYRRSDHEAADVPPPPPPIYDDDVVALLAKAEALPKLTPPKSLRNPHPLVEETRKRFLDRSPCHREEDFYRPTACTSRRLIHVSRAQSHRAMLLMDTLCKAIEKLGGEVKEGGPKWDQRARISLAGEEVTAIRLRERYRQQPKKPDADRAWSYPRTEYIPLGLLVLDSGPSYSEKPFACDTADHKIEDDLNALIIGWVHIAGARRITRRLAEEERLRQAEEEQLRRQREAERQRIREDLKRRQCDEQARVDALVREATSWNQARLLREYVNVVEQSAMHNRGHIQPGSELDAWMRWAREQADRLDPLAPSPPSILDHRAE
jgi:hypothetical protein